MRNIEKAIIYLSINSALGMAIAFLWHFYNIIIYGSHYIQEPNRLFLTLEITLIMLIAAISINALIIYIKWLKHE